MSLHRSNNSDGWRALRFWENCLREREKDYYICGRNFLDRITNTRDMDSVYDGIMDTLKFVVDGENAKKMYDILKESYIGKHKKLPPSQSKYGYEYEIDYKYDDGVLYIEERVTKSRAGFVEEVLDFFIPYDSYYVLRERSRAGEPLFYEVRDDEGKYFVRPPKTEYELQEEAEYEKKQTNADDLPF